ncbi:natriuretic peptide A-like [Nelusetta ayraudi]|uniref:natriuretic peptide A-like n=1 Tax=Nelusetta ayraudi TaxID=303726 RepID=UPI003F7111FE
MKMSVNVSVCSLSLLLLLECVRAEPASDLQSLKRMLVEEMNGAAPFHHLSEVEAKEKDAFTDKSLFAAPEKRPWDSSEPGNSALGAGKGSILARLLKDLMRTSKRSWSRYKKGGQRSCFGVRLERIGSFSGLGC